MFRSIPLIITTFIILQLGVLEWGSWDSLAIVGSITRKIFKIIDSDGISVTVFSVANSMVKVD